MSGTTAKPRIGYRVEINVTIGGNVEVLTYHHQPEGQPGWFATKEEAHRYAADRMSHLANELLRQADYLTLDERGR